MKQRNVVLTMLFAAFFAKGAQAGTPCPDATPANDAAESANLDQVQSLLQQLGDAKALEVDESGNVRVKPSVVEQLRRAGRLSTMAAGDSIVCN